MATNKNIRRITDTETNIRVNSIGKKVAILTDRNRNLVWTDSLNERLLYAPVSEYYDKSTSTTIYPSNNFGEIVSNDWIYCTHLEASADIYGDYLYVTNTYSDLVYTDYLDTDDINCRLSTTLNHVTCSDLNITAIASFNSSGNVFSVSLNVNDNLECNTFDCNGNAKTDTLLIENVSGKGLNQGNRRHTHIIPFEIAPASSYSFTLTLGTNPFVGKGEIEIVADWGIDVSQYYRELRYLYSMSDAILATQIIDNTEVNLAGSNTVGFAIASAGVGARLLTLTNSSLTHTAYGTFRGAVLAVYDTSTFSAEV